MSCKGMMPPSVAGSKPAQFLMCSSDRKRFMVLQACGNRSTQREKGTDTYATMLSGVVIVILPSSISTCSGLPQSRQGALMRTALLGKSQQTASASKPHWANHFCSPPTLMRYWVGRLLKGAKLLM